MLKNFKRLLPYIAGEKKLYSWGILFVVVSTFFQLTTPILIKKGIDSIENPRTAHLVKFYALTILLVASVRGIFVFFGRSRIMLAGRNIEYKIRNTIFARILELPPKFYDQSHTGDITSRAINDVDGIRNVVGMGVNFTVGATLVCVFSIVIMMLIDVKLALLSMSPLFLVTLGVFIFGRKIHDISHDIQEELANISTKAQENFAGVRVVKSFCRQDYEIEEFGKLCQSYRTKNLKLAALRGFLFAKFTFLMGACILITLYFGGKGIIDGTFSKGDFAAFTAYQFMLAWPMMAVGWLLNIIQRGMACMGRICEILDYSEIPSTKYQINPNYQIPKGKVEFRNLSFSYDDRTNALKDINLVIDAGMRVGITGKLGSGKSTLAHLLLRLYKVDDGMIFIDGVDINKIPPDQLHNDIGAVLQDVFLFSDTLWENIAFGANGSLESDITKAGDISQIAKDVEGFPLRYNQIVGERGVTLSGGQKQRTAIARALVKDPSIFVFDDAFSSVDTHTEAEILRGLGQKTQDKTTLIISHRISTIKDSDLIVVLDGGRIAESGTHSELVRRGGLYSAINDRQKILSSLEEI